MKTLLRSISLLLAMTIGSSACIRAESTHRSPISQYIPAAVGTLVGIVATKMLYKPRKSKVKALMSAAIKGSLCGYAATSGINFAVTRPLLTAGITIPTTAVASGLLYSLFKKENASGKWNPKRSPAELAGLSVTFGTCVGGALLCGIAGTASAYKHARYGFSAVKAFAQSQQ